MAYEKQTGILTFFYTMKELFDKQSLWSMYAVEHKAEDALDLLSLTDDEKDIATSMLEDATFDIMNRFLKYTTGIPDAIKFNEDYTPAGGGTPEKSVVLSIVDHTSYNENYLKPVDKLLEKTLRFYVLREWFLLKDLVDDATKAGASYDRALRGLLKHAFQLKKVKLQ